MLNTNRRFLTSYFLKSWLLALLISTQSFAQTGFFTEKSIFLGQKNCVDAGNAIRTISVELDDFLAPDTAFILRKVSEPGLLTCPLRPSAGETILHSSKVPEAFQLVNLDLTIYLKIAPFLKNESFCSQKGMREDGLLCLYGRDRKTNSVNLIAETKYRTNTIKRSVPNAKRATTTDELALLQACELGNAGLVNALLERGVDTEITDSENWRPLNIATLHGYTDIVRLLLENGADVEADAERGQGLINSVRGKTEYSYRTKPLQFAAREGHLEIAKLLLAHGAFVDGVGASRSTATPLAHATNKEMINLLIEHGADIDSRASDCSPPGYSFSAVTYKDNIGVRLSCERRFEAIQTFAEHAQLGSLICYGTTLLHLAAHAGCERIVEFLIEKGMDPNIRTPRDGYTPIHAAALGCEVDTLRLLLKFGSRRDLASWSGETPFQVIGGSGFKPRSHQACKEVENLLKN